MRHQCIVYFFAEGLKHSKSLKVLNVKIALAAPKITDLETYRIFSNNLTYARSGKGDNKYLRGTITIE